jgi:hypothetical protein
MANTGKTTNPSDRPQTQSPVSPNPFSEGKTKAQEFASSVSEKAKETTSSATAMAQNLAQRAGEVAGTMGHRAEEAAAGMGSQMKSLAETIREKAPHEGYLGSAASGVATTLESGGRYLQEHDLESMANDVTGLIRRYPIQSLLIGLGIGFLLARSFRS